MHCLALLLTSTLAVLSPPVLAKHDQIYIYPFPNDNCAGSPPAGSVHVKARDCQRLPSTANSLRPMINPDHDGWINDVNKHGIRCHATAFKDFECNEQLASFTLPEDLTKCMNFKKGDGANSVVFHCGPNIGTYTTTTTSTSFSMGPDGHQHTQTAVLTKTITDGLGPKLAARSSEPAASKAAQRNTKEHAQTSLWLLHPWMPNPLCYDCWSNDVEDPLDFKCKAGRDILDCGRSPQNENGEFNTQTLTQTVIHTSHKFSSTTTTTVTSDVPNQERAGSWHAYVTFENPFHPGQKVCADAEWEKRGQGDKSEIRLQDIKEGNYKKCVGVASIDIPRQYKQTVSLMTTKTVDSPDVQTETVYIRPQAQASQQAKVPAHKDL